MQKNDNEQRDQLRKLLVSMIEVDSELTPELAEKINDSVEVAAEIAMKLQQNSGGSN